VLNQCLTVWALPNGRADKNIYCAPEKEEDRAIGLHMDLTPGEFYAVREGMPTWSHQILLHRPAGESAIIDFDLTPIAEYLDVFSGRAANVREAEELRQAHPETWVEKFMTREPAQEAAE
jgi:type IV secretory pathway VirB4 component